MVDPTKGIHLPGVTSADRPLQSQKTRHKDKDDDKTEKADDDKKRDQIILSQKAISLGEANDAAAKSRDLLQNSGKSLGLNPSFDETV